MQQSSHAKLLPLSISDNFHPCCSLIRCIAWWTLSFFFLLWFCSYFAVTGEEACPCSDLGKAGWGCNFQVLGMKVLYQLFFHLFTVALIGHIFSSKARERLSYGWKGGRKRVVAVGFNKEFFCWFFFFKKKSLNPNFVLMTTLFPHVPQPTLQLYPGSTISAT